jgi:uncharacterized glyoxalase superfamily protein PhnB
MTDPIPAGLEGFIPHLCCSPCADAIEFYKKAFGAQEMCRLPGPDGKRIMHAAILIDGKTVFLADAFPEHCGGKDLTATGLGGTPVTLHRYVADCDAAFQQAIDAGATALMPVSDMFWGDRYGALVDPYGHKWSLATHQKDLTPDEMKQAMDEAFSQAPA